MLMQLLYRFLIGGAVVTLLAAMGDVLKPKSFAGLFGAAPSIALATLALTIADSGAGYVAIEARSMIAGALALAIYTWLASRLMLKGALSAPLVTLAGLGLWAALAFAGWLLILRGAA
jgi:hypothetical protein